MMGGLTSEDILALQAPLPLVDHEAREKGKNKEGTKKQYLIYINQEGVIPLLNSIDPNWSWDVLNVHFEAKYVSVTGRLTIKGVSRDGVGGNSPNGVQSPVDEDTVKGAETDALKRAALRFGVGLYLRGAPTFWIDANLSPWDGAAEALKQYGAWYSRTFKTQQPRPTQPPTSAAQTTGNGGASPKLVEVTDPNAPAAFDEAFPEHSIVATQVEVKMGKKGKPYLVFRDGDQIVTTFTREPLRGVLSEEQINELQMEGTHTLPKLKLFWKQEGEFRNVARAELVA
jgi:hypothetical protein